MLNKGIINWFDQGTIFIKNVLIYDVLFNLYGDNSPWLASLCLDG